LIVVTRGCLLAIVVVVAFLFMTVDVVILIRTAWPLAVDRPRCETEPVTMDDSPSAQALPRSTARHVGHRMIARSGAAHPHRATGVVRRGYGYAPGQ
jgi:hypothetical protein